MKYLNFNGQLVKTGQNIIGADNRIFRYGDGLFESIRVINRSIPLLAYHIRRLKKSMRLLGYTIPKNYGNSFFEKEILKLASDEHNFRVRLTVFRKAGGFYAPLSNKAVFLIEAGSYPNANFALNQSGLSLGICDSIHISPGPLSSLKTCNSLPYVIAGMWLKKASQFSECLLLNNEHRIAECSIGNLMLVKNNQLICPPLTDGGIQGVMRKWLLEHAHQIGLKGIEKSLTPDELEDADELWVSNAVRGIQWIGSFRQTQYSSTKAELMIQVLNKWCA